MKTKEVKNRNWGLVVTILGRVGCALKLMLSFPFMPMCSMGVLVRRRAFAMEN